MRSRSVIGGAALVAAATFASFVALSEQRQPAPLTLEEALARAVAGNPALRGSEYLLQASQARESLAAQRPPFELGAELEDFAGSGPLDGVEQLQTTLRLSGVLELGDRRAARVGLAESESDAATVEQRAQRLDLLADVAARFVDVALREEQRGVAREATGLAMETAAQVRERIRIGAAPDYELGRAEIQISRSQIELQRIERELASSQVRLAATWGATHPDFEGVSADLFALPAVKSFEELAGTMDDSPAIQRMLTQERVAGAELRLAEASRSPDVSWSGGVRHFESLGEAALVASVSVPIGTRRRAEPAIREAEALRSKFALDLEAARVSAVATLFALHREIEQARDEVHALHSEVLPKTEGVLRATRQAFRQGRSSFLELANAQQQLLDVRVEAAASAARYHQLLIEVERLTGQELVAVGKKIGESP